MLFAIVGAQEVIERRLKAGQALHMKTRSISRAVAGSGRRHGMAVVVGWLLFFQSGLRIDLSRPAVVQRIQRLQRLETVVYSMEKIVTGTQDNAYLPRMLGRRAHPADCAR